MEVHRAKEKYASQYSRESHALTNARKNNEIVENAIIRTRLPSIYLKNLCMICLAAKSKRHCLSFLFDVAREFRDRSEIFSHSQN